MMPLVAASATSDTFARWTWPNRWTYSTHTSDNSTHTCRLERASPLASIACASVSGITCWDLGVGATSRKSQKLLHLPKIELLIMSSCDVCMLLGNRLAERVIKILFLIIYLVAWASSSTLNPIRLLPSKQRRRRQQQQPQRLQTSPEITSGFLMCECDLNVD